MPRARSEKAAALADEAGQWIKCRVDGRPRYYGIRSESEPGHYHLVDLHTCCCRWARTRDADRDPCSHILAVPDSRPARSGPPRTARPFGRRPDGPGPYWR